MSGGWGGEGGSAAARDAPLSGLGPGLGRGRPAGSRPGSRTAPRPWGSAGRKMAARGGGAERLPRGSGALRASSAALRSAAGVGTARPALALSAQGRLAGALEAARPAVGTCGAGGAAGGLPSTSRRPVGAIPEAAGSWAARRLELSFNVKCFNVLMLKNPNTVVFALHPAVECSFSAFVGVSFVTLLKTLPLLSSGLTHSSVCLLK